MPHRRHDHLMCTTNFVQTVLGRCHVWSHLTDGVLSKLCISTLFRVNSCTSEIASAQAGPCCARLALSVLSMAIATFDRYCVGSALSVLTSQSRSDASVHEEARCHLLHHCMELKALLCLHACIQEVKGSVQSESGVRSTKSSILSCCSIAIVAGAHLSNGV